MVFGILVQDLGQCASSIGWGCLCGVRGADHGRVAVISKVKHTSLTLGLMGLDELHLRVLATSSEDLTEKANAKKGAKISRFSPIVN
jgi:hypothetical protein